MQPSSQTANREPSCHQPPKNVLSCPVLLTSSPTSPPEQASCEGEMDVALRVGLPLTGEQAAIRTCLRCTEQDFAKPVRSQGMEPKVSESDRMFHVPMLYRTHCRSVINQTRREDCPPAVHWSSAECQSARYAVEFCLYIYAIRMPNEEELGNALCDRETTRQLVSHEDPGNLTLFHTDIMHRSKNTA